MTKDPFLVIVYGTNWPLCTDVPLNTQSFIAGNFLVALENDKGVGKTTNLCFAVTVY